MRFQRFGGLSSSEKQLSNFIEPKYQFIINKGLGVNRFYGAKERK